jgi:hypothetical protein
MTTDATQGAGPGTPGNPEPATSSFDAAVDAELEAMGVDGDGEPLQADDGAQGEQDAGDDGQDEQPQDDEGEQQEDDAPPIPEGHVEWQTADGKKVPIPREVAELASMGVGFTERMQELAQHKGTLDELMQRTQEFYTAAPQFSQEKAKLANIDMALQAGYTHLQQNPSLAQSDPVGFATLTGQLQQLQWQRGQVATNLDAAASQFAAHNARMEQERVARALPVFQRMGLDASALRSVGDYAKAQGATPEQYQFLHTAGAPWAIPVLHKAMQWDAMQAAKAKGAAKVSAARSAQVLRPGTSTPVQRGSKVEASGKRLAATGSLKDAYAHEIALSERRFGGRRR